MSRKLVIALTAFVALNGVAGGSMLLTGAPNSTGSQAFAAETDFDPLSASQPTPARTYIPAYLAMIDFERVFAGPNALPQREYVPVVLTAAIDFQQVFRSVSAPSRDNTPLNREKLRNAGWRRLLEAS
jgi:hypothetical protein